MHTRNAEKYNTMFKTVIKTYWKRRKIYIHRQFLKNDLSFYEKLFNGNNL